MKPQGFIAMWGLALWGQSEWAYGVLAPVSSSGQPDNTPNWNGGMVGLTAGFNG